MRIMDEGHPAATRRVVVRHHALLRLAHWATVPVLLGLVASGLSIYWASPVHQHRVDPATGSTEYLADLGILISHLLPGPAAVRGACLYAFLVWGLFRLAKALRLLGLPVYLFMRFGPFY